MNSTGFHAVPTSETQQQPEKVHRCGIWKFKPRCLQRFADPKAYLLIYCAVGVLQGAYFTYLVGILSTLEKRFSFESKVSGIILIADNISAAVVSIVVGYYGTKWHKPRAVAFGMVMVSLSCFTSTIPYFMYGPALHLLTRETLTTTNKKQEFCDALSLEECDGASNTSTFPAIAILFVSNFLMGFGSTSYYTIGGPYLDDNVKKKNSAMYFSAMASLRIFGPTLGFLLSSFCLKFYEDPFYDPGIDPYNPRWVGAWWMGLFFLGAAILFCTLLLALFPRELPARFRSEVKTDDSKQPTKLPLLKDFPQAFRRLMKNTILVCHVISVTLQVNGFVGYFVFMPKFLESQYRQSASDASLFSGATGIVSMLLGILIGGFLIQKFKPRPRYIMGYMLLVEVFSVLGLFVSIFLGCDSIQMPGTSVKSDETLDLYNACNTVCQCTRRVFEPVCGSDGVGTYFSPCFAGCSNTSESKLLTNTTIFEDCRCVMSGVNSTFISSSVVSGFCSTGCNMFIVYIILLCISKFISSTARVGDTLITFRCIDPKDKSFALGVFGTVLSLFAFIPNPLIYGALTDSACLVWEESCSQTGNCWLYDSDKFRYYLHGMSILLISIGVGFDVVVFLLSDRLTNFYGEEDEVHHKRATSFSKWTMDDLDENIIFDKCSSTKERVTEIESVL